MEKQILCSLHTSVGCASLGSYDHRCRLDAHSRFATCKYQLTAVVPAEEQGESPENVVQQTSGAEPSEIAAETLEIKDIF